MYTLYFNCVIICNNKVGANSHCVCAVCVGGDVQLYSISLCILFIVCNCPIVIRTQCIVHIIMYPPYVSMHMHNISEYYSS